MHFLFILGCLYLPLFFSIGTASTGGEPSREKPNIILVLADDVSAKEYACYGGRKLKTPALDKLAADGLVFSTAWTSPVCGPSRAILDTGRYPARTNYYGNWVIPDMPSFLKQNLFLPQVLAQAGYRTAIFGKFHEGHHGLTPNDYGYHEHCVLGYWDGYNGPPNSINAGLYRVQRYWHPGLLANGKGIPTTATDFAPDMVVDRLNEFVKRNQNQPFFAFYSALLPHMETNAPNQWNYPDVPEIDQQGNKTGGKVPGSMKSNLEYLDHLLGRIINHLEQLGLREKTIIIFTGDNGSVGYGKGKTKSEVGPRVPLVVHAPGILPTKGVTAELIDFSDLLPTFAELAGGQLPPGHVIDGHSFAPLLLGKPFHGRDWIFTQLDDARWLRDKRWLLDGDGNFYDCGANRDETKGYHNVTASQDPEVLSARQHFDQILRSLPQTDFTSPDLKNQWEKFYQQKQPKH